jgi:hypothetical protein
MREAKVKLEGKRCSAKGGGGEAEGNECKVTKSRHSYKTNTYLLFNYIFDGS